MPDPLRLAASARSAGVWLPRTTEVHHWLATVGQHARAQVERVPWPSSTAGSATRRPATSPTAAGASSPWRGST
ncbi:hypothetical protein ACFQ3Z_36305 [Streptomyces nogalater]